MGRMPVGLGLVAAGLLLSPGIAFGAEVGHWTFETAEGDAVRDSSPTGLHGRAEGVAQVPTGGVPGGVLRFAGEPGESVTFPPSSAIAFNDSRSFAVELTVRTDRDDGFRTVLMTKDRPGGTVSYSFCIGREPGRLSFELWSWQQVRLLTREPVTDGLPHRISGVYDAESNRAALFVDGVLQASAPAGKGGPQTVSLRLGNNVDTHQPYIGELGDVVIRDDIPESLRDILSACRRLELLPAEEIRAGQQAYLDRMAAPRFHRAESAADWQARAARVREDVLDALGLWPLPERLPLDVRYGGTLDREGYTLTRLYWQTWPGYYASGHLYMPKDRREPVPAILSPHGHWEHGARNPVVQSRCIALARRGYAVLTTDSVHAYNRAAGLTPLTVMTWNNIRALDLLCEDPDVDAERIGVTGCSGGAQQTFYLMAVEERPKVAIPVCMVSEWRRILAADSRHCACNHVPGILAVTDTPEMTACFAPKPALLICVTGDWTSRLPTEGYPSILGVYERFGAADRVRCTQYDWHHDYSRPMREEAYGWFARYLEGRPDDSPIPEGELQTESLETLAGLDSPPAGAKGPAVITAELLARRGAKPRVFDGAARDRLAEIRAGFAAWAREADVRDAEGVREIRPSEVLDGTEYDYVAIPSEAEVLIPAVVMRRVGTDRSRPAPAVLLIDGGGKAFGVTSRRELVDRLLDLGAVVCAADPRPFGEHSLNRDSAAHNGIVFGRPELALAGHDVARVASYLASRPDTDAARTAAVGFGEGAVALAAGACLHEGFSRLAAYGIGDTYSAADRLPLAPRILQVADLPELLAAAAPRPLRISGMRQPDAFTQTADAYRACGAADRLRLAGEAEPGPDAAAWLVGME